MTRTLLISLLFCSVVCASCDIADFAAVWLSDSNEYDYNADDIVNFYDFAIFAQSYDCVLTIPLPDITAFNVNGAATLYQLYEIPLDGNNFTDCFIQSLPTNSELYDIYPLANLYNPVRISATPYQLKKESQAVYFLTADLNDVNFTYTVYDKITNRNSTAATVSITKTDYAKNSLCFAGSGYVDVNDNNAVDFDSSFAFGCWFRPQSAFGEIVSKTDNVNGFRLSIRADRLNVEVWQGGNKTRLIITDRLTLNVWYFFVITLGGTDNELNITDETLSIINYTQSNLQNYLPAGNYSNSQPLIIGRQFVGQIDKVSFWNALTSWQITCLSIEGRQEYNGWSAPTVASSLAYFKCDAGTGTTLANEKTSPTGTLHDVLWIPDNRPRRDRNFYNLFER